MTCDEAKLSAAIKSGTISGVYYFYGEEVFLTETYTNKILEKIVGNNMNDINLTKLTGVFSVELFQDSVESLPLFAEKKAVWINDLDCDKFSEDEINKILEIIKTTPEECVTVISMTGLSPEGGKKSRNKSFITKLSKFENATVCEFSQMTANKIAELVIKKAAKNGCVISRANAVQLAELTLCNLTLCSNETEKLCCYVQSGEITAEIIDSLVAKQLDTSIFSLANAINSGKTKEAFLILDDLFSQRAEPHMILAALSGAYIDYYRAITAKSAGKTQNDVVADFGYAKNRAFVVGKAFNAVSRLSAAYLRKCVSLLSDADIKLKTSSADSRTVLEQTIVGLFAEITSATGDFSRY